MTLGKSNRVKSRVSGVKPLVSRVNPAGDSTPARPETVAAVRNTLQGTGEAVLGLVGEL